MDSLETLASSQNWTNSQLLTLEQSFYDKLRAQGKSVNTLKNYRTDLDCFNQFLLSKKNNLDISDFNIAQVKEYGAYLEQRYNADNSRRRRVQSLRLFFDFLVEQEVFKENPVRALPSSPKFLDIPRPIPFIGIKTLWSFLIEQEQRAKDPLSKLTAIRNQLIVSLIYSAGLKVSDLSGLRMGQILLTAGEPRVMVETPRRDPYSIPLPNFVTTIFKKYTEALNIQKELQQIEFNELLFNANPYKILSGGLSARGLEVIFEEWRVKLLVPLTPKSLRQAAIYRFLEEQRPHSLIKEWLGLAPSYNIKMYIDHKAPSSYDLASLETMYVKANS